MNTAPIGRLADDVRAISDRVERARAATALLRVLAEVQQEIKDIRRADVSELRKTFKLRELSEMLDMSTARVDQISKGHAGGRRS